MRGAKYHYNPHTCSYEKAKQSKKNIFWFLASFVIMITVTIYVTVHFLHHYFDSPQEIRLKKENKNLHACCTILQQKLDESGNMLTALQEQSDYIMLLLGHKPIDFAVKNAGVGGIEHHAHFSQKKLMTTLLERIDHLKDKLNVQKKAQDQIIKIAQRKPEQYAATPSVLPISETKFRRISSDFGFRQDPFIGILRMHKGVDFSAPKGTPIYATAYGVVKQIGSNKGPDSVGNYVLIDHGHQFLTRYCHMDAVHVKVGQKIKRGQKIGTVGNTGRSTAPHLHYEVYKNGKQVDPKVYFVGELTPQEYEEIIKQASTKNTSLCSH